MVPASFPMVGVHSGCHFERRASGTIRLLTSGIPRWSTYARSFLTLARRTNLTQFFKGGSDVPTPWPFRPFLLPLHCTRLRRLSVPGAGDPAREQAERVGLRHRL